MKTRISVLAVIFSLTIPASVLFASSSAYCLADRSSEHLDPDTITRFEKTLDGIRERLKIPAMSCAIVKDQKVVWARGFGYADLDNKVPATEHTSYHLASLTKTFASTILMQLIQDGKVKLDDPVSKYGILLESEGVIRVKHLFSHTSEGNPGERYSYNGNRFAELDKVVQKASGKSFAELLIANILDPLDLKETAPNVPPIARTKSPGPSNPQAEGDVKSALNNLLAAYNSGKVDEIAKYVSPQQNAFRRDGGSLWLFADLDRLRQDFAAGVKLNIQVSDAEAAVYGDTALTTCFFTQEVTLPNRRIRNDGTIRLSAVWNKQNGTWKLVHSHESAMTGSPITAKHQQRFDNIARTLAQPYQLDDKFNIVKGQYPTSFSVSAGLMSSVLDMAKYDIAIDQNRFVTKETQQLAFTPMVSTKGESLPYGLGWFTQNYKGTKLIWHYGYWTCNSSLILKVPERNITFIAMANTDNLSRSTDLGAGDVTSSSVGLAFLKTFILPDVFGAPPLQINWRAPAEELKQQLKSAEDKPWAELVKKELVNESRFNASVGRPGDSTQMFKAYSDLYSKGLPDDLMSKKAIAEIVRVNDNADKTAAFSVVTEQSFRVFAIGEGQSGEMFDFGWIEDSTGKRVWEMKFLATKPAGGVPKNRLIEANITLAPGQYKLRYKSDDSHSFDSWNALPPSINFWGIAVYQN
ncbi:MAG TPA: serine hydrolase [Blastocatellia bacterium]|nr:serine hydrolase [Blastocatellia bacterium]